MRENSTSMRLRSYKDSYLASRKAKPHRIIITWRVRLALTMKNTTGVVPNALNPQIIPGISQGFAGQTHGTSFKSRNPSASARDSAYSHAVSSLVLPHGTPQ